MTPADRAEDFLPKIVTVWREGYGRSDLRADALAGLTVAIVALPLSMAIAIASGVGPERGLYTTIIGGFLVSALGGSRFQIGGPAGAFIVLVAACVGDIGVEGLIVATFQSGILLAVVGALRMGTYIRFIPYPVTVAFTAGIAVIILASQLRDFFGVTLDGPEPGPIIDKLAALWDARATITSAAMAVSAGTVALVLALRRLRPSWPGLLIAVIAASAAAAFLGLPVETIGSRFGELPRVPPVPSLPAVDAQLVLAALPWATSFALLGAIESLLSAVVADGMSGRRHRSNAELVAQGVANMGSALFGGFCVTGTIARTATNVRAGSRGPVSGMLHAVFVLGFMLVAAPLASYIPLAALAGVLVLVAWNMAEKEAFWTLLRASRADAAIVLATFLLVVFRDLTEGIIAGAAIGGAVFIRRMSEAVRAESPGEEVDLDPAARQAGIVVFRLRGAWFFGAAATIGGVLERVADRPRALVVDFAEVPFVDSSGIHTLELLARKMARNGGQLVLSGMSPELRASFESHGLTAPAVRYERNPADAIGSITGS
jgi:SulP family sulfate permease